MLQATSSLTKSQKAVVQQVSAVTSCRFVLFLLLAPADGCARNSSIEFMFRFLLRLRCSEAQAVRLLKECGWTADTACEMFFERGMEPEGAGAGTTAKKAIELEFSRLADPADPPRINIEQLEKFAAELGVDMFEDPVILVIAYMMGAKKQVRVYVFNPVICRWLCDVITVMTAIAGGLHAADAIRYQLFVAAQGSFHRDEFVSGFSKMGVESVSALKSKLPSLRSELSKPAVFTPFWTWAYEYSCEDGQKSIPLDVVKPLTQMLLNAERFPLVEDWIQFLETQTRTVTKDTWALLLEFGKLVKPDLSNYEASGDAWPVQFDDFVEWKRAGKNTKRR